MQAKEINLFEGMEYGMKYKSIDLFAGIGGIRLGFDNAFAENIETVFVSEWDTYAQKTYRANFEDDFEIAGDITKIEATEVPEFDICLAGFPCQAFSLAGARKGFEDDYKGLCRGTLFLDVARICEKHKPKVIFCENVKGLTIHDRGRTFKIITKTFEDYLLRTTKLEAASTERHDYAKIYKEDEQYYMNLNLQIRFDA